MYFDKPKQVKLKDGQVITLRRAQEEDASAMIEYLNIVGGESDNLTYGAGEMRYTVEQEIDYINKSNSNENALMLIAAADDDSVVSIANINAFEAIRIAHVADFGISVRKSHWRLGLGRAIMKELIEFARRHDKIEIVHLGVRAGNDGAVKLYESFGFERVGYNKRFFKAGDKYYDNINMELHLNKGDL